MPINVVRAAGGFKGLGMGKCDDGSYSCVAYGPYYIELRSGSGSGLLDLYIDLESDLKISMLSSLCGQISAAVLSRCAPLRRLRSLLGLLEAGMADVVNGWVNGSLAQDGWEMLEVEHMINALFEDSEYRRDALKRVRSGP